MNIRVVMSLMLFTTLTLACGTTREKKLEKKVNAQAPAAELVDNLEDYKNGASVSILAVRLTGNTLVLDLEFSGGCETHHFRLLGSKMILKSMPPQRGIMLYHENNGDSCRELLQQTVSFDIQPLAYPGGEIILLLDGWKDRISYTPAN